MYHVGGEQLVEKDTLLNLMTYFVLLQKFKGGMFCLSFSFTIIIKFHEFMSYQGIILCFVQEGRQNQSTPKRENMA